MTQVSAQLFWPLSEAADRLLDRRHRKVRKAGAHFAHISYPERHRVRIALKKLRYATDFFRSLHDEKHVSQFSQLVAAFQDILGHINDVATATRLASLLASPETDEAGRQALARAAGVVIGWHSRGLATDEPRLVAEWHEFRAARPFWKRHER